MRFVAPAHLGLKRSLGQSRLPRCGSCVAARYGEPCRFATRARSAVADAPASPAAQRRPSQLRSARRRISRAAESLSVAAPPRPVKKAPPRAVSHSGR
jgi:hypothetical protein